MTAAARKKPTPYKRTPAGPVRVSLSKEPPTDVHVARRPTPKKVPQRVQETASKAGAATTPDTSPHPIYDDLVTRYGDPFVISAQAHAITHSRWDEPCPSH